jgi:glycosyl transferase family 25
MNNCVFINLNRRIDRRMQIEMEFARMGISAERFPAIAHSIPALGCTMSHLAVLKLARDRNYPYVCVFEDDFEFLVSKDEYTKIIHQIPNDFDVVMLGWYVIEAAPYNDIFGKVLKATTTSAYIMQRHFYDKAIQTLEEAIRLFQEHRHEPDANSKYVIDQYWSRLQPSAKWLYSLRRVGRQRPGFSDLVGEQVAYDY